MSSAVAGSTATIHGAVYKWDTFEPLNNTMIEVNSTPTQEMVAKNGKYSIELVPGNYNITGKYYQNSALTYAIKDTIKIKNEGDFVLDLLLLPVNSEEFMDSSKVNRFSENLTDDAKIPVIEAAINKINNSNGVDITERSLKSVSEKTPPANVSIWSYLVNNLRTPPTKQSVLYSSIVYYVLIALASFFLLVKGYRIFRKHKRIEKNASQDGKTGHMIRDFSELVNIPRTSIKVLDKSIGLEKEETEESNEKYQAPGTELVESELEETPGTELVESELEETPALKKELLLSKDLQEVIDVIRGQNGMITQKNLCSRLKYSEVKVSLMLSNLEKRKRIKKFKRGRENLVVLMDEKH
jgi:uncharacterized membrane protein